MDERNRSDVWTGLFVLLGALALLFLSLQAGNLLHYSWQKTFAISAHFDNIGGLKPKAPVKSAGVVIGHVKSITLDNKTYRARVVMEIFQGLSFPKDSSLKILTSGLLGEQYIGLEAGADSEDLTNGDTISQTQSAVVLENLISQFLYNKAADGKEDKGDKK